MLASTQESNVNAAQFKELPPIRTGDQYIESLRGRNLKVHFLGERIAEPVDHPVIRPSINAIAATYDLAVTDPELAQANSPFTGEPVNRFLHIAMDTHDLVLQNKMQRKLGQLTGTCFQRCVGMDALNALYSVTYEIDEKHGTPYHERLKEFITMTHRRNVVIGGAMTDVKGDRGKAPHEQSDPDVYVHIVKENEKGVWITGAKAHQTGCINSHWLIVMPTLRLGSEDAEFAIVGAIPVEASGITYIYGRQSCDTRSMDGGDMDAGNARFAGQEALVIFKDVFIPWEYVFMHGEVAFASMLVERFTCYHRRSYVCKSGVGDVLIGAAAAIANYNGVPNVSHIREKLVEMTHLNETIYSTGIASSHQSHPTKSGCYINDDMIANVCKHHVTKMPYEISRLAQDLAGGLMVTLPSEKDLENPETGDLLKKYLKGRDNVDTKDRLRILRLIENMTLGQNAVGYLTESMHGAGSPQAQRIQIARQMQLEYKKKLAKRLAGVEEKPLKNPMNRVILTECSTPRKIAAVHKTAAAAKVEIRKVKFSEIEDLVGQEIGITGWFQVTQQRVNAFAKCTLDSQWIHIDEERAREESPYGGTIAHGYLTLSLLSHFTHQLWEIDGAKTGINYGLNRVRFPSPVNVGSRIRARGKLIEFKEIKDGIQYVLSITIEIEGRDKPACVAEAIFRAHW